MTRKKVKLAYISNDSARKATFKKRKKGLMKKVNELSTLCGISACAIVYSPYDASPDVWPSPLGVQRVVSEFRMLPEMDQSKKMVNLESFIRLRISKATDHLKRQRKDNREKEMTEVMFQCLIGNMGMFHLNLMDLNDLGFLVDQYGKDVNRRIEILRKTLANLEAIGESSSSVAAFAVSVAEAIAVTSEATAVIAAASAAEMTMAVTATTDMGSSSTAPVNPFQQYQNPTGVMYDQAMGVDANVQRNQHQWYLELINHPEQMGYVSEELNFPFMDETNNNNNMNPTNDVNHTHNNNNNNAAAVVAAPVSNTTTSVAGPTVAGNIWPAGGFFQ